MSEAMRDDKFDTAEIDLNRVRNAVEETDDYGDGFGEETSPKIPEKKAFDNSDRYLRGDKNQQNDKKKSVIIAVVSAVLVVAIIVATVFVINGFSNTKKDDKATEATEQTTSIQEETKRETEVVRPTHPATQAPVIIHTTAPPTTKPPVTKPATEPTTQPVTEPVTEATSPQIDTEPIPTDVAPVDDAE